MAGPIQTPPQGLLGLLQLKELGKNPSILTDQVQSSYDLRDQYMQGKQVWTQGAFGSIPTTAAMATSATGFNVAQVGGAAFQVPQGETWYVEAMTAIIAVAAADNIRFACCVRGPALGAAAEFALVGPDYTDTVTARARVVAAKSDRPFWLISSNAFGIWVIDNVTATTQVCSFHLRVTKMQY